MKIIKPYARMLPLPGYIHNNEPCNIFVPRMGEWLLKHIEWSARISHRSEDAVTEDSWKKIIEHVVLKHGDWSVVEHATVSVDMVVDRGITHEWVRHRLNAFTQESTRFVNYEKKMPPAFIYPIPGIECEHCLKGKEMFHVGIDNGKFEKFNWHTRKEFMVYDDPCAYDDDWLSAIAHAERIYKSLLIRKWRPQEARSVFPNALASRIVTTSNLRNWRHMFIMRTSAEAHPQMRQVMIPLLKEFQGKIPLLFDDIIPEMKQSEAMKRMR